MFQLSRAGNCSASWICANGTSELHPASSWGGHLHQHRKWNGKCVSFSILLFFLLLKFLLQLTLVWQVVAAPACSGSQPQLREMGIFSELWKFNSDKSHPDLTDTKWQKVTIGYLSAFQDVRGIIAELQIKRLERLKATGATSCFEDKRGG